MLSYLVHRSNISRKKTRTSTSQSEFIDERKHITYYAIYIDNSNGSGHVYS